MWSPREVTRDVKYFLYTAFDYSTHLNHCAAIVSTGSGYLVTFIELQICALELEISPNVLFGDISK